MKNLIIGILCLDIVLALILFVLFCMNGTNFSGNYTIFCISIAGIIIPIIGIKSLK